MPRSSHLPSTRPPNARSTSPADAQAPARAERVTVSEALRRFLVEAQGTGRRTQRLQRANADRPVFTPYALDLLGRGRSSPPSAPPRRMDATDRTVIPCPPSLPREANHARSHVAFRPKGHDSEPRRRRLRDLIRDHSHVRRRAAIRSGGARDCAGAHVWQGRPRVMDWSRS